MSHRKDGSSSEESVFHTLLESARDGSRDAMGELFEPYRAYLLWLANHELSREVQAKGGASDMVQQTFLRAQQRLNGFRGGTSAELQGWLRRILLNSMANFHRDYCETEKRQVSREATIPPAGQPAGGSLVSPDPTPSSLVRKDEENQELMDAIGRLPEDYRQVMTLRYWHRLSFAEIGKLMDRSADAARKLWARAFERLEKELDRPNAGDSG